MDRIESKSAAFGRSWKIVPRALYIPAKTYIVLHPEIMLSQVL